MNKPSRQGDKGKSTSNAQKEHSPLAAKNQENKKDIPQSHTDRPEAESTLGFYLRIRGAFKKTRITDRITAFSTVIIMIATTIYAFISFGQWRAMREQISRDQRAWVFNKDIATDKFGKGEHGRCIKEGEKSTFEVILKNIGKTPAHVTNVKTYLRIIKTGEKPDLAKDAIISSTKNPFIMFPETTRTTGDNLTEIFTKERLEAIESRQVTLYILGVISYKDIFGQLHWTEFCESLDSNLSSFSTCPFYNETDDTQNAK